MRQRYVRSGLIKDKKNLLMPNILVNKMIILEAIIKLEKTESINDTKKVNCYLEMDNDDIIFQEHILKEVQYLEHEELKSSFSSIDELHSYFKHLQSSKNDIEIIYLAYLWVTRNILFKFNVISDLEDVNIKSILKTRQTSSKGFNLLFCSILEHCSFKIVKIKGLHKTVDHTFDNKSGTILAHEWIGILYQGKYRLVDCVLGSGYFYEDLKFIKMWNKFYFFVSPLILIYSHFPDQPNHSFLNIDNRLLTLDAFYLMPNLNQFYFKNHLHIIYTEMEEDSSVSFHPKNDFTLNVENNEIIINFGIREEVNILATLKKLEEPTFETDEITMVRNRQSSHNSYFHNHCESVLHSVKIKLFEVVIRPPTRGEYLLNIYSSDYDLALTNNEEMKNHIRSRKKQNEDENVDLFCYAFSFYINLTDAIIQDKENSQLFFPLFYNVYYEKKCELIQPLYYNVKNLIKDNEIFIKIVVPMCVLAGIFLDDTGSKFLQMEREGNDIFSIKLKEESLNNNKFYIVASFSNSEEDILAYLVEFSFSI